MIFLFFNTERPKEGGPESIEICINADQIISFYPAIADPHRRTTISCTGNHNITVEANYNSIKKAIEKVERLRPFDE